ncbi:Wzz/FepE/Etk N-terminal domain-containing protein [Hydrogenimonas sp.]
MTSEKNFSEKERQVMVPYGYMPYVVPEEESIDLRMLWQTLVRRKGVLLSTVVATTALALLYLWIAKPVYEAKALLQIGSIDSKILEKPATLKTKLDAIYHIGDSNVRQEYPYISAVTIPKKTEGLIQLTALGLDNESAVKKIRSLIEALEIEHANIVQNYVMLIQKQLAASREKAKRLKAQIEKLSKVVGAETNMLKETGRGDTGIASVMYSKNLENLYTLQSLLADTQERVSQYEMALSPLRLKKTQRVGEIAVYDHPVKPRKGLIVAIAVVSGLILGILMVFFLEMVAKEKEGASR